MIINKSIPFVDYNYWLNRLDTQSFELSNSNLVKVPKVFEQANNIRDYKTLGTSYITALCPLSFWNKYR